MQEGRSQYGGTLQMSGFESSGDGGGAQLLGIPLQKAAEESSEMAAAAAAEEESERGVAGNRWPQEETLALLRIRSDMDGAFRDATLKGPLWEEVSRKLDQLGYKRSAKKCKEKFENVQKYYKRTKDGRAGRQDGKSYRFFRQLESLYGQPPKSTPQVNADVTSPLPLTSLPPPLPIAAFSSSDSDSDDLPAAARKRKNCGGDRGKRKMMAFFETLTRQVMERQEEMQSKFLDMIEKRENERMIREEAWRRQEMARMAREHEALAQERAMAASRDATILTFLQKMTGHAVAVPPTLPPAVVKRVEPPEAVDPADAADPAAARWPKTEVHALISLRSGMETKYQEVGPKAPLWEEIAAGMRRLGYNRSAKRCKEKWENINKYFKKVKDSKKKRPEDAKTCPYFHQLDALYRRKSAAVSTSSDAEPAADAVNGGAELKGEERGVMKKPEDILKEMERREDSDKLEETDSDGVEQVEEEDEEDEEKAKMAYKIQYQQRPVVNGAAAGENQAAAAAAAAVSFMAMVQ